MSRRMPMLIITAGVMIVGNIGIAAASSLSPNCTVYQNQDAPVNCTTGATATALSTPGAYQYGNTALLAASGSGGVITGSAYPAGYTGASFYDAYIVQITSSLGSTISSTENLGTSFGISNFEERLYQYSGTAPIIGPVTGALDAWTLPAGSSGTVAVLPSTFLGEGTYVVEVRGDVTGTAGGSYSGTLQLSPVPLPASAWLLAAALCGLAAFVRSSKRATRATRFANSAGSIAAPA